MVVAAGASDTRAVVVEELWEGFTVHHNRVQHVKELLSRFRLSAGRKEFWALKGIDLEIPQGQTLGLIGANGSGKSTLLRCIAGILLPTKGRVLVRGSVSSLIELGAGFNLELTGRENIVLGGALFGLTRRQIKQQFNAIVEFSEVEAFLDEPVRTYSSGMNMRLAFALAVHVNPSILLVDEVLAVGDESFQRKCIQKVVQLGELGTTIVFVTHDLSLLDRICRRTVCLEEGVMVDDGETEVVVRRYLERVT